MLTQEVDFLSLLKGNKIPGHVEPNSVYTLNYGTYHGVAIHTDATGSPDYIQWPNTTTPIYGDISSPKFFVSSSTISVEFVSQQGDGDAIGSMSFPIGSISSVGTASWSGWTPWSGWSVERDGNTYNHGTPSFDFTSTKGKLVCNSNTPWLRFGPYGPGGKPYAWVSAKINFK